MFFDEHKMSLVPLNGADTLSTLKFDSSAASARSFDQDVRIPPYFVRENAGDFFVENSDWNGDDAWLDRINNDVVGDETSTAGNVERDYVDQGHRRRMRRKHRNGVTRDRHYNDVFLQNLPN